MGSVGAPEILVILVVALIVLGPNRLPEAARQVGKALAELRKMSSSFQDEIRDAITPVTTTSTSPSSGSTSVTEWAPPDPAPAAASLPVDSQAAQGPRRYSWSDLPPSSEPGSAGASGTSA